MINIINLLSKQDKRYLKILESLFFKESSNLNDLIALTKNSRKTIREDIQIINSFIKPATIETSLDGCQLKYPNNIGIDFIYSCILKNSVEYTLLEMIFFEKKDSLEDYANELYLSTSTVRRIINNMNKSVKRYQFQISSGNPTLIGNEANICNTMINFFKEKYITLDYPFSPLQKKALNRLIEYALKKQPQFINFSDIEILKLVILVSLSRIQRHHFIENELQSKLPDIMPKILDDKLLKTLFKSVFRIELSHKNLVHLFYPFINGNFATNFEQAIEISNNNSVMKNYMTDIHKYLDSLASELDISIKNKNKVVLEIFNLITLNYGNDYLLFDKKKLFLNNFSKHSPYVTRLLYENIDKYFSTPEKITENDKTQLIYILVVHWDELSSKLYSFNPIFNAGIFMNWDTEHSQFIANILSQHFIGRINFKPIVGKKINDIYTEFKKYDFIVTNISNMKYTNKPIIICNEYPSTDDLFNISSFYSELLKKTIS